MEANSPAPLKEMWYYAAASETLKPGRVLAKTLIGEPLLLGRGKDGGVFALRDLGPHRDQRIKVKAYPAREVQGNVWVFFGEDPESAPEIAAVPEAGDSRPKFVMNMRVGCLIDQAVFSLMDPTHNPFVHVSWWWRKADHLRPKAKAFAPAPFGFIMLPHTPSSNLRLYRLLGGAPQTQIIFRLPSTRIEHLRFGRRYIVTLSTVTPIGDHEIEMSYAAWWSFPLLTPLKPVVRWGLQTFSRQDRDILEMQSKGLKYNPSLMLIGDADAQAKWYHQLKNEYARSRTEGRPFVNPVKDRVLNFRS